MFGGVSLLSVGRTDKVVCRSNSLCFSAVHAPTHVSLEICTFRCLVGHVFQRSGPVDRNMFATMVNMSQVIFSSNLICICGYSCSNTSKSVSLSIP
jgi:hypothetical protein